MATELIDGFNAERSYNDDDTHVEFDSLQIQQRYDRERLKRLRDDAAEQYVDCSLDDKFSHFVDDPYVDASSVKDAASMFPSGRCELLVLGAGFGGLLYAVRMVEAGMLPEDIRIVDPAGGFGGTWYYNRYPGLMCDIESYCYLPLLEETGYVPKHRYSYGQEIREYANLVAQKYRLTDSAVFSTKAEGLEWDEAGKEWRVKLTQYRQGAPSQVLDVRARFVITSNGVLNWSKLPNLPGIGSFEGKMFHTSRWDYETTGGSEQDPSLTKLKDKRVAIVGTGASAIQVVPHLARWSKHLHVIQRTPSAIDHRDQRETDSQWFAQQVASGAGWQRERMRNFHQHFTTGTPPKTNVVDDEWTRAPGLVALSGNRDGPQAPDQLPEYLNMLYKFDNPRQERIRARVDKTVSDSGIAQKLKPEYPSWCKRPCFHDEYLPTFNLENVTLVDTDGKGPSRLTHDSIVVGEQTIPVDLIVFATGFRPPYGGTPAEKANMTIVGRKGVTMTEQWEKQGPSTLHGVLDHDFPNLFLSGPWQAATSPNYLFGLDQLAKHAAYVWSTARKQAKSDAFVVAPSKSAAEAWGTQVLIRSVPMAAILGCTPGYFNLEGMLDKVPQEAQAQVARSGLWGHGIEDFLEHIEAWRSEGNMKGIEVEAE